MRSLHGVKKLLPAALVLFASCSYRTTAWVAPWDPASQAAAIENRASVAEVDPVWFSIQADGSIAPNWHAEDPALRAAFPGRELIPVIQNARGGQFDGDVVEHLLATDESMDTHVKAIITLVDSGRYDGIEIDYESLAPELRDRYSMFIERLANRLHSQKKLLSVVLDAKTADSEDWRGPGAEDWRAIGRAADSVKVMAYDFHFAGSEPGPLAPLDWLGKIVAYAQATIPLHKVIFGLPWYGYDWQNGTAKPVTYAQAMQLAPAGVSIHRDANGELYFMTGGQTVWFEDADSYRTKVAYLLSRSRRLGGFASWKPGTEDPAVWARMQELGRRRLVR